jgi:hypothetical protein
MYTKESFWGLSYSVEQEMYSIRKSCLEKLDNFDIVEQEDISAFLEDYYEGEQEAKAIMAECHFHGLERAAIKMDMTWFARELIKRKEEEEGEAAYDHYLDKQERDNDAYINSY